MPLRPVSDDCQVSVTNGGSHAREGPNEQVRALIGHQSAAKDEIDAALCDIPQLKQAVVVSIRDNDGTTWDLTSNVVAARDVDDNMRKHSLYAFQNKTSKTSSPILALMRSHNSSSKKQRRDNSDKADIHEHNYI
jgi:hypothetical protein